MSKQKNIYGIFLALSLTIILATTFLYKIYESNPNNKKNDEPLETIILNEVVHSVFYAPQYVALANGYFEEQGLSIKLITGNGADKSMTSLLTGESHIILAGPESSIYIQANKDGKEIVNVAQLTKKAGNFLLAKNPTDKFNWNDVKGKTIIGGRPGGIPQITLEYILTSNGIDPVNDVNIITNLDFTATSGAFATGEYDYTVEFEPNATALEAGGYGKVVASLGVDGGEIPFTSYIVTKEFAVNNKDIISKFLDAIAKGQQFVENNSARDVAKVINQFFETIPEDQLSIIIDRYKKQNTWNVEMYCDYESYEKLETMLISAGTLDKKVDLVELIDNSYINTGGE